MNTMYGIDGNANARADWYVDRGITIIARLYLDGRRVLHTDSGFTALFVAALRAAWRAQELCCRTV